MKVSLSLPPSASLSWAVTMDGFLASENYQGLLGLKHQFLNINKSKNWSEQHYKILQIPFCQFLSSYSANSFEMPPSLSPSRIHPASGSQSQFCPQESSASPTEYIAWSSKVSGGMNSCSYHLTFWGWLKLSSQLLVTNPFKFLGQWKHTHLWSTISPAKGLVLAAVDLGSNSQSSEPSDSQRFLALAQKAAMNDLLRRSCFGFQNGDPNQGQIIKTDHIRQILIDIIISGPQDMAGMGPLLRSSPCLCRSWSISDSCWNPGTCPSASFLRGVTPRSALQIISTCLWSLFV